MKKICVCLLLICSLLSANSNSIVTSDEEALFEEIFQEQMQLLPWIHHTQPKLLVLFSATPGMGKTSIAKNLEDRLHALRVSRDEAREILARHGVWSGYGKEDEKRVHAYFTWLLNKIATHFPNQLMVLDCKCYNNFATYKKFAQTYNYEIFLIHIDVKKEVVEQRIRSRGKDVAALLNDLDAEWHKYELFVQEHKHDHIFNNNKEIEEPFELLVDHIHQKLKDEKS